MKRGGKSITRHRTTTAKKATARKSRGVLRYTSGPKAGQVVGNVQAHHAVVWKGLSLEQAEALIYGQQVARNIRGDVRGPTGDEFKIIDQFRRWMWRELTPADREPLEAWLYGKADREIARGISKAKTHRGVMLHRRRLIGVFRTDPRYPLPPM